MRKTTVFGIIILSLILLMNAMPLVNATYCTWDGLRYVYDHDKEGGWIKYPHPDRIFYNINPYTTTGRNGTLLHHLQIGHNEALLAVASVTALCACVAGALGASVGGIVAGALAIIIPAITEVFFLDEVQCIWMWVTLEFLAWWNTNANYLLWISLTKLGGFVEAVGYVVAELIKTGYFRVGTVLFIDSLDISSGGLGGVTTTSADKLSLMAPQIATTLLACVALVFMRRKFGGPLHHLARL